MLLNSVRVASLVLAAQLSLLPSATAQVEGESLSGNAGLLTTEEAGHGATAFRLGYYFRDDSGDGNPFLDEELTVLEPVIIFDYNVTDRFGVTSSFSYDYVSSASIERLGKFPEQSGASGDNYFGASLGLRYRLSDTLRMGVSFSESIEYDYTSLGLAGYVARDLANKNATVKLNVNTYYDRIDVIRFNGVDEGNDERTTLSSTLSWYQTLTSTAHMELGVVYAHQSGFLEVPFNAVVIEDPSLPPNPLLHNNARGLETTEALPGTRNRAAIFGSVRRYFDTGTSLELVQRYYGDSWGIYSLALEPRIYQWLVEKVLYARLRYRFYAQNAADDYQQHFSIVERHRTQDSDLGDFTSHGVGLKLYWIVKQSVSWDIGADYVFRSDGLDYVFASSGITYHF